MNSVARLAMPGILVLYFAASDFSTVVVMAQEKPSLGIVTLTTQEDHQNMLQQLGIKKLRPGPSGNEAEPNHANYDESLANPFPELPPLLVCNDGTVVSTAEEWSIKRRPEIVELFENEVVGRIPTTTPQVNWKVLEEKEIESGDIPIMETTLEGVVENTLCPEIEVKIAMKIGVPIRSAKCLFLRREFLHSRKRQKETPRSPAAGTVHSKSKRTLESSSHRG